MKSQLMELIKTIQKDQYAGPFLKPVDFEALGLPDYPHLVKKPIDLQTLLTNLRKDRYEAPSDFLKDLD